MSVSLKLLIRKSKDSITVLNIIIIAKWKEYKDTNKKAHNLIRQYSTPTIFQTQYFVVTQIAKIYSGTHLNSKENK